MITPQAPPPCWSLYITSLLEVDEAVAAVCLHQNRWWERNCDEENSWGLRINKVRGRKFRQRRKALKNQRVHN
jgi:hypothetical protein